MKDPKLEGRDLNVRIGSKVTIYDPDFNRKENDAWIKSDNAVKLEDKR